MARTAKTTAKSPQQDLVPTETPANKPIHTIRYRSIKVAVWKNDGQAGVFYSITPSRSYQDEQKQWHDTTSFHAADLPTLAKAILDAHSWIAWQERKNHEMRAAIPGGGG